MQRRNDLFSIAIILLAAVLMHGHGLLRGKVLLPADIVLLMRPWAESARDRFPEHRFAQNPMLGPIFEYYSWRYQVRQRMRQGEIPLWNPMEMSGNVLLANSQSAPLYPPNVLLYVLPLWLGINLVTFLHTALTGLLMYGFLRSLGLQPASALTGALAWMLSGPMLVWTEFQTPTAVLCWLPGALWAIEAAARDGRWLRGWMSTSVCLTLSLVAGHPQFAFYVILLTVLYALWRCGRRSLWLLPAVLGLSTTLGSATLLPVAEASRINHRSRAGSFAESVRLRLPPEYLAGLVLPNVLGNPRDYVHVEDGQARPGHPYVGRYEFIEYCHYAGTVTLILALFAMGHGFRRPTIRFFALLGALGLALALGTYLGAVFFYVVPGYAQFHAPARAVCMLVFALCVLAAYGWDIVCSSALGYPALPSTSRAPATSGASQETPDGQRLPLHLGFVSGACALAAFLAWPLLGLGYPVLLSAEWISYEAGGIRHAVLFAALTALTGALLYRRVPPPQRRRLATALPLICAADLLMWGYGFNPATDPAMLAETSAVGEVLRSASPGRVLSLESPGLGIKGLIVPNYNAVVGYREVQGADSVHTLRYHRAMAEVARQIEPDWRGFPDNNTVRLPGADHPLLDALNVTHVTTCPPMTLPTDRFQRLADAELTVWRNPRARGPAWITSNVVSVGSPEEAVRHMRMVAQSPTVVEGPVPPLEAGAAGSARLLTFSAHRVEYAVETSGVALLVTSEPAYPGWKAIVHKDGRSRPVPIRVAEGVLRAVVVPKGTCRVEVRYEPGSFLLGCYLTCLSVSALTAVLTSLRRGEKVIKTEPPAPIGGNAGRRG